MERLPDLSALYAGKDSLTPHPPCACIGVASPLGTSGGGGVPRCADNGAETAQTHPGLPLKMAPKTRSLRTKSGHSPGGVAGLLPVLQPQTPAPVLGIHRTHAQVYFAGRCYGQGQTDFYHPATILIS